MLRVTLKGLLAHKVRLVATALAVLLGVAFMTGTQVLTSSLGASFDKAFADVYAPIDVVVRASSRIDTPFGSERARIDGALVSTVEGVDGVAAAEGQVVAQIRVLDRDGVPLVSSQGPPNVGLNWLTTPELNGWTVVDGRPPTGPGEIVLDGATARDGGYDLGDEVDVSVTSGVRSFTVVGIARFGELDSWGGAQAALFDTATAQELVGEPGAFDWISVAADGISQEALRARVATVLPAGVEATTGAEFTKESQDAFERIISVLNTFLLAFSLIALFVGSFIIYNTFSIIVAQRTRELALLRALGASRGQVVRSVLLEATVAGLAASAMGVVCGIGLAVGLTALLSGLGFTGPETPLVVTGAVVVMSLVVGTLTTLVAAFLPARRAAAVAPVAAMRQTETPPTTTVRVRAALALGMLVGGCSVVIVAVDHRRPTMLGFGALVVLLGLLALGPEVAPAMVRALGRPLPRFLGIEGRLAKENAARSPKRTSSTAAALMIAVALIAFVAATASSVKASTTDAIDSAVRGQYVITSDGFGPTALPSSVVDQVRSLPEVAAVAGIGGTFAVVDDEARLLLASQPADLARLIEIDDVAGSFADLDPGGIAVSSGTATDRGISLGDEVLVSFPNGATVPLRVSSIYQTRFPLRGPGWIVSRTLLDANVPPSLRTDSAVYVMLEDPSPEGIAAAAPALQAIADAVPGAELQDVGSYGRTQAARADQFLLVVYVLLALSLVIATIGVVNTLILSVTERTRELGLLRAVGMTRRQVRSSIRWEALLIALVGTAIGVGFGLLGAWGLVRALREDGITTFMVEWRQVLLVLEVMTVATVVSATYPAWRASRLDVLEAIATE